MKYLNLCVFMVFLAATTSCNRDEIFEREQYKHIVSLMSNRTEGIFNIFEEELDLEQNPSVGYIAASCGGALAITEPILIQMEEDLVLLREYNFSNFEMREDLYINPLSLLRYSINAHQINIPANERSGRMKIEVNARDLSPDSAYFIPFRITRANCELNPDKTTLLYRMYMKNFYATNRTPIEYQHVGEKAVGSGSPVNTMMSKRVFPLSGNSIRMFAGNQTFNNALTSVVNWSIKVEIAEDGRLTITPWKDTPTGVKVRQIDDDEYYPNIFKIEDLGYIVYKTFFLCYEYDEPFTGVTNTMKERLRLEYKPNQDKK